jgi:hypothetical protein
MQKPAVDAQVFVAHLAFEEFPDGIDVQQCNLLIAQG